MNVLVAEDDRNFRRVLTDALQSMRHRVVEADNGMEAQDFLRRDEFDVVLLDLNLPGRSGLDVLRNAKNDGVGAEVIILTGDASVATAVEAMKLGAYDYLTKPFNMEELAVTVEKALEKKKLLTENLLLRTQIKRQTSSSSIVSVSPLMHDIIQTATRFAASNFPVLVAGESGVGKELIARAIHDASHRAEGPFIAVNCGAIPETMIESELFGHEMGAFTGAHARKLGLLEIANRGTLFLDEIGELPVALQVRLLRVLESGSFFRLGGTREVTVDVKFVAATNKDLRREAERGLFRSDLFYRISALTLHIPPVRERREDIPILIEHFLKATPGGKNRRFSASALAAMERYAWPGNVRELQNIVHRVVLLTTREVIEPSDLPADLESRQQTACYRLEDIEREHILKVLREMGGQKGRTAEALGIAPKTLYNKLMSYGLSS